MTPLRQAATALLDAMVKTDFTCRLGEQLDALEKALEAEQAQAVEPVTDDIVAGALYDFLGYLTSRRTRITMSDRDDAGAAADALVDWSKTRKINLAEARVRDWNDYTHPAPPPAGERAELIARLRNIFKNEWVGDALREAADMLEADATSQARERHTRETLKKVLAGIEAQQVAVLTDIEQYQIQMAGISTAALGYWSEEDEIHPDYDTLALRDVARLYVKYDQLFKEKEARRAQQVAVPMTEAQIFACDPVPHEMFDQQRIDFARAIEAFHGINRK